MNKSTLLKILIFVAAVGLGITVPMLTHRENRLVNLFFSLLRGVRP